MDKEEKKTIKEEVKETKKELQNNRQQERKHHGVRENVWRSRHFERSA